MCVYGCGTERPRGQSSRNRLPNTTDATTLHVSTNQRHTSKQQLQLPASSTQMPALKVVLPAAAAAAWPNPESSTTLLPRTDHQRKATLSAPAAIKHSQITTHPTQPKPSPHCTPPQPPRAASCMMLCTKCGFMAVKPSSCWRPPGTTRACSLQGGHMHIR